MFEHAGREVGTAAVIISLSCWGLGGRGAKGNAGGECGELENSNFHGAMTVVARAPERSKILWISLPSHAVTSGKTDSRELAELAPLPRARQVGGARRLANTWWARWMTPLCATYLGTSQVHFGDCAPPAHQRDGIVLNLAVVTPAASVPIHGCLFLYHSPDRKTRENRISL